MGFELGILGNAGLQFFGRMTASISHEIKNVLAIINEDAGLLEDLASLAEKGRPLEIERVKVLAAKMKAQIKRGDEIVKRMNRFAHSIDEPLQAVDLDEILTLMASLAERPSLMREIALEKEPSRGRVTVRTNPFILENLIWLCLDFAIDGAGESKTVILGCETGENGVRIRIKGLKGLRGVPEGAFPKEEHNALLRAVKGDLAVDAGTGEVVLVLPLDAG
jgi:C4-dicarboxylate-specific signal transduction histidine kinase